MPPFPAPSVDRAIADRLLAAPQYRLSQADKSPLLLDELWALTLRHLERGPVYRSILEHTGTTTHARPEHIRDIPFLPARLFKRLRLQSVPDERIVRLLKSSGTTSAHPSLIAVDSQTSMLQIRSLAAIVTSFIGPKRLPMIIIDIKSAARQPGSMSARGAGLLGLSNFGRDHFYALNEDMELDIEGLKAYAERYRGQQILLFGFTFMVWKNFCLALRKAHERLNLDESILIHGGGWKKLQDEAISNDTFRSSLAECCGINRVHDFYGMVEQVGSIFMECEYGYLHAPDMADVLIRDHRDWSVAPMGVRGLVQALSVLPESYPGHSILTEDLGTLFGVDDCPCGRLGARFKIHGRAPSSELRGCSDTYAASLGNAGGAAEAGGIFQLLPLRRRLQSINEVCSGEFLQLRPTDTFAPIVVDFLDALSASIFRSLASSPELSALAFWLRRGSIRGVIQRFQQTLRTGELSQPLGLAFHVAPSNVDTIFLYSWALGMLAGNLNIVRLPQRISPQLARLLDLAAQTMADARWNPIAERNALLTYGHDDDVTRFICERADVRLVWGGDETVNHLRTFPVKPTTREVGFAAKSSCCAVNAQRYLEMDECARLALAGAFFIDAYPFDQMACSSPHFVFFVGTEDACTRASVEFWRSFRAELNRREHSTSISTAVDKLVGAYELFGRGVSDLWTSGGQHSEAVVVRVGPRAVLQARERTGGGFFVECFVEDLLTIADLLQRSDQTLTYVGYDRAEMLAAGRYLTLKGIDRIVPVGQALHFGAVWDGYDLLGELTRRVSVS